MNKHIIQFLCLCLLSLTAKLNFNISKTVSYSASHAETLVGLVACPFPTKPKKRLFGRLSNTMMICFFYKDEICICYERDTVKALSLLQDSSPWPLLKRPNGIRGVMGSNPLVTLDCFFVSRSWENKHFTFVNYSPNRKFIVLHYLSFFRH